MTDAEKMRDAAAKACDRIAGNTADFSREYRRAAGAVGEPMWCDGCRATGAVHCAHPDQCGYMLSATAAADNWKSWIDDLPLPEGFDVGAGRLQDFITALAVRIDVPQPANATPPASMSVQEAARVLLASDAALTELAITTMRANRLNDGKRIGYQPALEVGLRALAEQEKADG